MYFVIRGIDTSLQTLICAGSVTSMIATEDNIVVVKWVSMGVIVNPKILNTSQLVRDQLVL